MKTNRLIRKSTALFMALAVFAMIFTGCKKDSSSSSSGGGDTPTPTPPTGNYGTIVVGDQNYTIHYGVYTVAYDEDIQANEVGIALTDGTGENANSYTLVIPFYDAIPNGSFNYYIGETPTQGQCGGMFVKGATGDMLVCISGTATITKTGEKYKIVSQGQATPDAQHNISFSVNFEGPLTLDQE
ncbi:MAG: hypothetical protein II523_02895 [Bacteroidales bacterium]|nr:hypothetical protein [Bacteroidales bacterium]